jgi:hypothetical protein
LYDENSKAQKPAIVEDYRWNMGYVRKGLEHEMDKEVTFTLVRFNYTETTKYVPQMLCILEASGSNFG